MIFMVDGGKAVSSLVMHSPMPGCMVVPPDKTMLVGGAARQDDVGVEALTDVHIALHDGLERYNRG